MPRVDLFPHPRTWAMPTRTVKPSTDATERAAEWKREMDEIAAAWTAFCAAFGTADESAKSADFVDKYVTYRNKVGAYIDGLPPTDDRTKLEWRDALKQAGLIFADQALWWGVLDRILGELKAERDRIKRLFDEMRNSGRVGPVEIGSHRSWEEAINTQIAAFERMKEARDGAAGLLAGRMTLV